MPYVPLPLPDTRVNAAISMATEQHLEQAHYLLSATYPNCGPFNHFGTSAAIMTLLTIAAASAIRYFNPKTNKKAKGDRAAFTECVGKFFPWDFVSIDDDQHRPISEGREVAATELYDVFRNPLVHSGGVTSKPHLSGVIGNWYRTPRIVHVFPGLASPHDNEKVVAEYCAATLCGDTLIKLEAFASTVYTRPLYWCTRKMIEAFAADPEVQRCRPQPWDPVGGGMGAGTYHILNTPNRISGIGALSAADGASATTRRVSLLCNPRACPEDPANNERRSPRIDGWSGQARP